MFKIGLYTFFFAILVGLHSCQKKGNVDLANVVEEWTSKEIKFDDGYIFTRLGKDSIYKSIPESDYKILVYTDTIGCVGCNLRLSQWMEWMKQIKSVSDKNVSFLFFIHPKDVTDLLFLLQRQNFDVPVCIDKDDSLNKINHFPSHTMLQTFLLDKHNKVLAIGNPMHNPKIKELYWNIMFDEQQTIEPRDKQQTDIIIDKKNIDFGSFNWKEQKVGDFLLTNVGGKMLIVDHVTTSCGCTTVEYSKEPVRPGKNLVLKIKYQAEHPEHFDKTITVYCNAKGAPFPLKISGDAK